MSKAPVIVLHAEGTSKPERDLLRRTLSSLGYALRVATSRAEGAKCLAPGDVSLQVFLASSMRAETALGSAAISVANLSTSDAVQLITQALQRPTNTDSLE